MPVIMYFACLLHESSVCERVYESLSYLHPVLRCWRNATASSPFPGRSVLAFSPPFEAFVPLHAASMRQERGWSVSWCCPLHEPRSPLHPSFNLPAILVSSLLPCEQPATFEQPASLLLSCYHFYCCSLQACLRHSPQVGQRPLAAVKLRG